MDSISLSTEKQSYRDEYMRRKKSKKATTTDEQNDWKIPKMKSEKNERKSKYTIK